MSCGNPTSHQLTMGISHQQTACWWGPCSTGSSPCGGGRDDDSQPIAPTTITSRQGSSIRSSSTSVLNAYTDADLAADLNALTFAERQAMEADIHGVNEVIQETPEFISEKIEKMCHVLN